MNKDALLDFRFGWRYLLPNLNVVRCVGLSAEERCWWDALTATTAKTGLRDSGCLVNLDRAGCLAREEIGRMQVGWVCAWGSGADVRRLRGSLHGFESVREYALLPGANPRIVVPLSSCARAVWGLRLHRPGRLLARFGTKIAEVLATLGNCSLLRNRVLIIAARGESLANCIATTLGGRVPGLNGDVDWALYLGNPQGSRKTVLLPITDSEPASILKSAEGVEARADLWREARVLESLSRTRIGHQVPRVIALGHQRGVLLLAQEYRSRRVARPGAMTSAVIDFLVDLANIAPESVSLRAWSEGIRRDGRNRPFEAAAVLWDKAVLALGGLDGRVWVHTSHGDFAPWNCNWSNRGLFVFDWELSATDNLALHDCFYYIVAPFLHVSEKPDAARVVDEALRFACRVISRLSFVRGASDDTVGIARAYLSLWLMLQPKEVPLYRSMIQILTTEWQ